MGRLRTLSGREVCAILARHGFVEVRRKGSGLPRPICRAERDSRAGARKGHGHDGNDQSNLVSQNHSLTATRFWPHAKRQSALPCVSLQRRLHAKAGPASELCVCSVPETVLTAVRPNTPYHPASTSVARQRTCTSKYGLPLRFKCISDSANSIHNEKADFLG